MSSTRGRRVEVPLTNKSGGSVAAGDVVILDSSNDDSFTTTTTGQYTGIVGIAQETIANNATGRVLVYGEAALVNVPASVTRGHYIQTHTVAKQATGNATRQSGSFGVFKTGGTTPKAIIGVLPAVTASGNVASDAIWDAAGDLAVGSGADTAVKLAKGNAGGVLAMLNGAVAWNAGTSFPVSPATSDRYFRTDLGLEFYYDGTRWLSTNLFDLFVGTLSGITVTGVQTMRIPTRTKSTFSIWVESFICTTFVATTNDGSNNWTVALEKLDTSNSATSVVTQSTSADTVSTWTNHEVAVGVAFSPATNPALRVNVTTKTGTPGSLTGALGLTYRLIGT